MLQKTLISFDHNNEMSLIPLTNNAIGKDKGFPLV